MIKNEFRKTNTHLFFWNSFYSQWYTTQDQFEHENIQYPNAEKFMMVMKAKTFNDNEIINQMLKTDDPRKVKALGRKVKNFDQQIWDSVKEDIVTKANYLKFKQNDDLKKLLIEHKDLILVEASPVDRIWGIGLHFSDDKVLDENKWRGQNLLGKCIMNARKQILQEEGII
jgi:ribA/ribD-fused uncharacterized protein